MAPTSSSASLPASSGRSGKKRRTRKKPKGNEESSSLYEHPAEEKSSKDSRTTATNHRRNHNEVDPLLVLPPDDAVEDTSFDDPYVYSDDSGSLSDAYFFPDHDSIHAKYSENDYKEDRVGSSNPKHAQHYGATSPNPDHRPLSPLTPGAAIPSRITLNGILEDSPLNEVTPLVPTSSIPPPPQHNSHHNHHPNTKQGRLLRKQLQQQRRAHMIRRKQLQEQRERAVKRIRGKPQAPTTCHDVLWLIVFVLQLLFVVFIAIRYGWTLVRLQPPTTISNSASTASALDSSTQTLLNDSGNRFLRRRLATARRTSSKPNNSTTTTTTTTTTVTFNTTAPTKKDTPADIKSLQDDDNVQQDDDASTTSSTTTSGKTTTTTTSAKPTSSNNNDDNDNSNSNNNNDSSSSSQQDVPFSIDYQNIIKLFTVSGVYALVISYLSLGIMLIVARALIPLMLVFSVLLAVCWGVFGLTVEADPYSMISILGFIFLIASLGYALVCWNRISFCSTNLYTAICAMRDTPGVLFVGVGSLWIAVAWCWVWSVALMGILNMQNAADCEHFSDCGTHVPLWRTDVVVETLVLILSFYWTLMVIKNVVRVTVAGAIGAWWFASPRQQAPFCCCDNTVWGPLSRATSNSLGSVCLGSLIVLPAQTLSVFGNVCCWMVGGGGAGQQRYHANDLLIVPPSSRNNNAKEAASESATNTATADVVATTSSSSSSSAELFAEDDEDAFAQECSGWMDRLWRQVRCCNRWAFTYIGMYGYSFSQGGEKAIQLFETREWMDIVRDNLIQNILLMASIVIGGLTGIFAVVVEEMDGYMFTSLHQPIVISFWIGSILGFVLSNILLLGVVGSAVNTILVCFAADPFEFDKNHPVLSREMRDVWSQQVWEPSVDTV